MDEAVALLNRKRQVIAIIPLHFSYHQLLYKVCYTICYAPCRLVIVIA